MFPEQRLSGTNFPQRLGGGRGEKNGAGLRKATTLGAEETRGEEEGGEKPKRLCSRKNGANQGILEQKMQSDITRRQQQNTTP